MIREAVGKVERWLVVAQGGTGRGRRRRARGRNQGNSRGGMALNEAQSHGERSKTAGERRGSEEDSWEMRATHGPPPRKQQQPPTKADFPGPSSGFQMTIPAVH